ncbi:ABC-F family ATP-binding cassette domain-containing protein [Sulfuriroseicoccus oceanibius]|uniref:ABC-F family ATP-binding cassette domain-containing protein n=1 Tax=Sulfuriroseicoccus oceanibius TaxID=2707525 RepID=A0A6B3L1W2_9BACT|nr:ABC-F family ATP-binding cassette domain-containing protein [Sulfuriroseicoccus oceanibius]QQL45523.1 ABC-F family ATP-binding cassette domain-containing protein [Sulfuriroseicoccus oceanibius]
MSDTPAIASASELTVAYGHQSVLDGATLAIHEGDRVGLVGRNGSGKSTLLKIAAGVFAPDSGEFVTRRGLVTGYLPQDFELDESSTVLDAVLSGAGFIRDMIAEYESLPADSTKAADLMERITHFDGWTIDQRAESLLNNLHAPAPDRVIGTLSGGEKRRVALCRALLPEPDFLILDEPTNHLETGSIEWLEQFLNKYRGTCLFVTHDRYFLDRITTRIVEIRRGKCETYEGNYTDFLITRAERDASEAQAEHKRQRFLKKELEWVRKSPSARRTKSRDRLDRYFEEAGKDAPEKEMDIDLIIPPAPQLSNRVIEATNIGFAYDERVLFENLTLKLEPGERLGIVGANGLGKSTLLKTLLGKLEPTTGSVKVGTQAVINFVDQDRLLLDDQKAVWEDVGEGVDYVQLGTERISLRSYLRRFLFTEDRINTKIELLSGGERSRVLLAKILKRGGNVLVLDEPTNDLDLATLRVLEEALVHFDGCVIVVSHDRYFLNRVCTATLGFEGNGVVHYQEGNYDYYLEKKAARDKVDAMWQAQAAAAKQTSAPKSQGRKRKLTYNETRELETIEEDILAAEEKVATLEAEFTAPDFYENHADDWQQLEADLKAAKEAVPVLYERWEELEKIKNGEAE